MNHHVIIGWLGGNSELFIHHDFKAGRQIAEELKKSPVWTPIYSGSMVDLIRLLGKIDNIEWLTSQYAEYCEEVYASYSDQTYAGSALEGTSSFIDWIKGRAKEGDGA